MNANVFQRARKRLRYLVQNSAAGMIVAALLVPDDQRARGFFADARGQLRRGLAEHPIARRATAELWDAIG